MFRIKWGRIFLLPHLFLLKNLNSEITNFNLSIFSERYFSFGKFERSLAKPFYKDYENYLNLIINGFVYKREFISFDFRTYFIWQVFKENLDKEKEKIFLKSPFFLDVSIFSKTSFPFRFSFKTEELKRENKILFSKKKSTYTISQSLNLSNFPKFNFFYSYNKEVLLTLKSLGFNSSFSLKKHSFYFNYKKELPDYGQGFENVNFNYNNNTKDRKIKLNIIYLFRKNYGYTNSNFNYIKLKNFDYIFDFYYSFKKSKIFTSQSLNSSFKKYFSDRIISSTFIDFETGSLPRGTRFYERVAQIYDLKFLNYPRFFTFSPYISFSFSQDPLGKGWGYLVGNRGLFEQNFFLNFRFLKFFYNLYYRAFNDKWPVRNQKIFGFNTNLTLIYDSPRYIITLNFNFDRNFSFLNSKMNIWTEYRTRIDLKIMQMPLNLSYFQEYIRTDFLVLTRSFFKFTLKIPLKLFNIFSLEERLYFRNKLENSLTVGFERNYNVLNLKLNFEYIYLIYPKEEHNFVFYFLLKRDFKIK